MTSSSPTYIYPVSEFPPCSVFELSLKHPALIVPARRTAELRNKLTHVMLHRHKTKSVYPLSDADPIPPVAAAATCGNDSIPANAKFRKLVLVNRPNIFQDDDVIQALIDSNECCKADHEISVSYSDWTVDEVLRKLLPVEEVPSAFEIIGHLAHVNLREELLPFKYLIGKVLLDKNVPRIKTVVNKIGSIATEYRTFGMEVIAGDEKDGWSLVTVKEEGCVYELDFRQVYWNSRLGGEHRRLVDIIREDAKRRWTTDQKITVVADMMAGIGPFAVPLTSDGAEEIHVHANDLNPASHKYLEANSKRNKCRNLHCYNMDARAFCHRLQDEGIEFHHVLMNLPASAPEFLDAFRGFSGTILPRIHVHCFGPKDSESSEQQAVKRCAAALGCDLDFLVNEVVVHTVRDVAPKKNMYCVSFTLPDAIREIPRISLTETGVEKPAEPLHKRTKIDL